jgi:hypothetical protein
MELKKFYLINGDFKTNIDLWQKYGLFNGKN